MTERSGASDEDDGDNDPTVIDSVAVTVEDAIAALEATMGTGRDAVLRVTPPFSSRMRARLHIAGEEGDYAGAEPVHITPAVLVEPVPAYPTAAETAAELGDEVEPNTDQHRRTHTDRLDEWRDSVRDSLVDATEIDTAAGAVAVEVRWLGDVDG